MNYFWRDCFGSNKSNQKKMFKRIATPSNNVAVHTLYNKLNNKQHCFAQFRLVQLNQNESRTFSSHLVCRDEEPMRKPAYTNKKRMQAVLDEMGEKYKNVYNEEEPLVKPRLLRASTITRFFGSTTSTTNYFWKNNGMLIVAVILVVGVLLMVDAAMKPVNVPRHSKVRFEEMEKEARTDLYSTVKGKMNA